MSEVFETITLEFEDSEAIECEIMGVFEVEGEEYIALLPANTPDDEDEAEVFLYRYKELDDEFELEDIETDEEFEKVAAAFDVIMAEEE